MINSVFVIAVPDIFVGAVNVAAGTTVSIWYACIFCPCAPFHESSAVTIRLPVAGIDQPEQVTGEV